MLRKTKGFFGAHIQNSFFFFFFFITTFHGLKEEGKRKCEQTTTNNKNKKHFRIETFSAKKRQGRRCAFMLPAECKTGNKIKNEKVKQKKKNQKRKKKTPKHTHTAASHPEMGGGGGRTNILQIFRRICLYSSVILSCGPLNQGKTPA